MIFFIHLHLHGFSFHSYKLPKPLPYSLMDTTQMLRWSVAFISCSETTQTFPKHSTLLLKCDHSDHWILSETCRSLCFSGNRLPVDICSLIVLLLFVAQPQRLVMWGEGQCTTGKTTPLLLSSLLRPCQLCHYWSTVYVMPVTLHFSLKKKNKCNIHQITNH